MAFPIWGSGCSVTAEEGEGRRGEARVHWAKFCEQVSAHFSEVLSVMPVLMPLGHLHWGLRFLPRIFTMTRLSWVAPHGLA